MLAHGFEWLTWWTLLLLISTVNAYIPATPTNSTTEGSKTATLHLEWSATGSHDDEVIQLLAGTNGSIKGSLVQLYDMHATIPLTIAPWIALVACDANMTDYDEVFTLARINGATAILMYSLHSSACPIDPPYKDLWKALPSPRMHVFTTRSLQTSRLIDSLNELAPTHVVATFILPSNVAPADDQTADDSGNAAFANHILSSHSAPEHVFMVARDDGSPPGPSQNTSLAMIVLYVITGCVSALFCVVIVSGAVRAVRHPERYGPRSAARDSQGGGGGQSRARGLTRAILDTFPVVKFGPASPSTIDRTTDDITNKDVEARPSSLGNKAGAHIEMTEWEADDDSTGDSENGGKARRILTEPSTVVQADPVPDDVFQKHSPPTKEVSAGDSTSQPDQAEASTSSAPRPVSVDVSHYAAPRRPRVPNSNPASGKWEPTEEVVPASMGRETCPICIIDFEEGDDLRVLPCEGKHRFHQRCVDPWLLELSSSCPICRQDFHALETILSSGESEEGLDVLTPHGGPPSPHHNRFSRYLRFARRRHRGDEYDPTDPYMPTAPETHM